MFEVIWLAEDCSSTLKDPTSRTDRYLSGLNTLRDRSACLRPISGRCVVQTSVASQSAAAIVTLQGMTMIRLKPLANQVIVVTGASSGMGRATALLAASRGSAVVVAARGSDGLETLVAEIVASGGRASAHVTDVTDPAALNRLATQAVETYGTIDTWVNNAGVAIAGKLEDLPDEEARRVFDVNFWGMVYGCKAALPHLKRHGGVLVNMGSVTSDVAAPFMGLYSASKQAIRGYTDALRIDADP
jgi:NAD(P)-dependent dehydrogenase (short-subunit alcohol dehydrogenase family)